ncbi:MAG: phage head-tail connector protein [Oscillospiraceae bacterium]|nr:phage head-tail connector protein [Oscillospiraceae bacterium]
MSPLESVKMRLGIRSPDEDCLLMLYLEDARAFILSYTNRTVIPIQLYAAWASVAVKLYNRRGMEGDARYTAGDVTRVADTLPPDLSRTLGAWRLSKVVSMRARG